MVLKPGQHVVVLKAYYGGCHEFGVLIKKCEQREFKGQWWVDLGFTKLPVEPERIVDAEEYAKRERNNYKS